MERLEFDSRESLIEYAEKHKIQVNATKSKPYSVDANIMHISYEGGILEDPWKEAPEDIYQWTTDPQKAPNTPEFVTIEFEWACRQN